MTVDETSERPFAWNVAGLLANDPGADRVIEIEPASIELDDDTRLARPFTGLIRLLRTNRGILAHADLHASLALECSRCLRDIDFPVDLRLQEEYLPSLDLTSGRPVATDDEPDALRLTDHHELDLEAPIRDATLLAVPIAALCRDDCPGLCPTCGLDLEGGPHDHPDDDLDPRLEALRGFRPDAP